MATFTSTTIASSVVGVTTFRRSVTGVSSSPVLGLLGTKRSINCGRVRCCSEEKERSEAISTRVAPPAAALVAVFAVNPAALALVDERMSTEGTGLIFGLSDNLLGWILLGVFGLIWSLYTVYTSTLDEDEDSGLSL